MYWANRVNYAPIQQSGVQGCIFYLLGLELIPGEDGQEHQAQAVRFPDEQDLEALCKMLATAGKKFDQPKTKTIMKIIILRMVELSDDTRLPSRARFLVKDVLETRDHMWEPRRKVRIVFKPARTAAGANIDLFDA